MMKNTLRTILSCLLAGSSLAKAADVGPVSVHGTFSQGFVDSQDNNYIEDSEGGTFDFREYGINGLWSPCDKVNIAGQVFAREYGSVGNDEPYLDYAYLDYRPMDVVGMRLGKMKVPNGLYNETREIDALRTEILLPSAVYMELARELMSSVVGVGIYGDISLNSAGTLSYSSQYGKRQIDEDDGDFARILSESYITIDDTDMGDSYAAKLEWATPVDGLTVAGTYSTEDMDVTGSQDVGQLVASSMGTPSEYLSASSFSLPIDVSIDNLEAWVLSSEYTLGNLVLASEWSKVSHESSATLPGTPVQDASGEFEGYYFRAGYRWSKLLDTAVGFSTLEDVFNDSTSHDTYLSLRFDITKNFILKIEEHLLDGTSGLFKQENPDGLDDNSSVFLAKATMYF